VEKGKFILAEKTEILCENGKGKIYIGRKNRDTLRKWKRENLYWQKKQRYFAKVVRKYLDWTLKIEVGK
jgi:hypothetical protein